MRLLKANEINARVNQVISTEKFTGVSILLYKDARVDMAVLDEEYGQNNWQVEYQMIGSQMFCTILLWDNEKKDWIRKQSNGTESNMEAEKGQASDAFKRAGFMVGIGRELYSAPDILVSLDKSEIRWDEKTKKWKCDVKFIVDEIDYDDKKNISRVVLSKEYKGKKEQCYEWPRNYKKQVSEPKAPIAEDKAESNPEPEWKKLYNSLYQLCPDKEKLQRLCHENGCQSAVNLNAFFYGVIKRAIENEK